MVIDDSILRSGIRVARLLGLGGMAPEADAGSGPGDRLAPDSGTAASWMDLLGDGSIRIGSIPISNKSTRLSSTSGDARAAARPERGAPEETFIDLYATLATAHRHRPQPCKQSTTYGTSDRLVKDAGKG